MKCFFLLPGHTEDIYLASPHPEFATCLLTTSTAPEPRFAAARRKGPSAIDTQPTPRPNLGFPWISGQESGDMGAPIPLMATPKHVVYDNLSPEDERAQKPNLGPLTRRCGYETLPSVRPVMFYRNMIMIVWFIGCWTPSFLPPCSNLLHLRSALSESGRACCLVGISTSGAAYPSTGPTTVTKTPVNHTALQQ